MNPRIARVESYTDINAKNTGCGEEYIGESGRTLAERFTEHQQPPSPIFDHCVSTSGHNFNINKFTLLGREDQNVTRAIKERVNDPSLNRNVGNTISLTSGMRYCTKHQN